MADEKEESTINLVAVAYGAALEPEKFDDLLKAWDLWLDHAFFSASSTFDPIASIFDENKVDRPKFPNYASPIIHKIGGRDQLVLQGCNLVSSFDPMSGEKLWEHAGATTECVSSIVTDGERLFRHVQATAHSRAFFLRKAQGWALRTYGRVAPDAVRRFVDDHEGELSGLTVREATKHL